jgi:predicted permease
MFGAALFVRTLGNLQNVNTGFAHSLLLFGIDAFSAGYKGRALNDFYSRVQERLAALPSVVSATASFHVLLSGAWRRDGIAVLGYNPKPGERMIVYLMPAGPEFFKTMNIPLLLGRDFTDRDNEDAPKAAVVNETFVKRYFRNRSPIGQRIGLGENHFDMEIVGVAADAKYASLRDETPATVYQPFRQAYLIRGMHFELRTAGNPKSLIRDVRRVVASIDRNVPLYDVKTQDEQIGELLLQERLFAKLSAFFGVLALALVCVGLYGVLSYAVARRSREIGIRMAVGARRGAIVSMVLKETMFVVVAGLLLGIPASFAATHFAASVISDLLYGLEPNDVISLVAATAALIAAAAFASLVPARRASRVDPITAIRHE